ncbi:hypothetical protein pipiens_000929, partial [Culex pipiens pipiens]
SFLAFLKGSAKQVAAEVEGRRKFSFAVFSEELLLLSRHGFSAQLIDLCSLDLAPKKTATSRFGLDWDETAPTPKGYKRTSSSSSVTRTKCADNTVNHPE